MPGVLSRHDLLGQRSNAARFLPWPRAPGVSDWGVAGYSEPVEFAPEHPACSFECISRCFAFLAFASSSFSPGRRFRSRSTVAGCHPPPFLAGTHRQLSSRANLTGPQCRASMSSKINSWWDSAKLVAICRLFWANALPEAPHLTPRTLAVAMPCFVLLLWLIFKNR